METNEIRIALEVLERQASTAAEYGIYVGLDVHEDTIAVAVRLGKTTMQALAPPCKNSFRLVLVSLNTNRSINRK